MIHTFWRIWDCKLLCYSILLLSVPVLYCLLSMVDLAVDCGVLYLVSKTHFGSHVSSPSHPC